MDQFLSRFTFGLLMAQIFPGSILLLSLTCPVLASRQPFSASMSELFMAVGSLWFGFTKSTVVFFFLAGGLGMLLHGVSWMVLAWLENHNATFTPVRQSFWHEWPIISQILVGPVKMVRELFSVLKAPNIDKLAMHETGASISPVDKPIYDFFQDFYLYFSQFYAHTAYALLFSIAPLIWTWAVMGFTWRRGALLLLLYFAASIFFLIGRVQYASLGKTEKALEDRAAKLTPGLT